MPTLTRLGRLRIELRSLLGLAAPIMIAQLANTAMGFVDTVMAGRVSPRDLAAVAVPKLIASLVTWLACLWTVVQRRRQRLPGATFARASLLVAIPALVALYLSLPSSR